MGETAAIAPPSGAEPARLSRKKPAFCFHDGEARPLADPYVSRAPLELVPTRDGGLRAWPARPELAYEVDGEPGRGGEILSAEGLQSGVQVALARRVLVLVEQGRRDPPRRSEMGMVGVSGAMVALREQVFQAGSTRHPVLLRGETGTGKELAALAIHRSSDRRAQPFVAVNLAAVPAATAASQFFGHARGAFTDAARNHRGYFDEAHGGTLFLDEVGAAPPDLQDQLLRALDQGEVQPVGGRTREVDVRIIAATDADLEQLTSDQRFRQALLYRIAGYVVVLPPLRQRPADVATQLVHFLRTSLDEIEESSLLEPPRRGQPPGLPLEVTRAFLQHDWPGNTRELRAAVARVALHSAHRERVELPPGLFPTAAPAPAGTQGRVRPSDLSGDAVRSALRRNGYRIGATAQELGIARNSLYGLMADAGIPRAKDLTRDDILGARGRVGDSVDDLAQSLEVSLSGLRLRMKELRLR